MPRDANGVYHLPEVPFVPTEIIRSEAVNSDFNDIGSALTNSIAVDVMSNITGPIKGFAGTVSVPGYTFINNTFSGICLGGVGVLQFVVNNSISFEISNVGISIPANRALYVKSLTINDTPNQGYGLDTSMLFIQSVAPTGWTRVNTGDNILRITEGTVGSGGTEEFSSIFVATLSINGQVGDTTLSTNQIPSHTHLWVSPASNVGTASLQAGQYVYYKKQDPDGNSEYALTAFATNASASTALSGLAGENLAHTHALSTPPLDFDLEYVDTIMATKV